MFDKKYQNQKLKIINLVSHKNKHLNNQEKDVSSHTFFKRFINLFNFKFTEKEYLLLEKGFKYNLPSIKKVKSMEVLGVETEFALKDQPNNLPLKFLLPLEPLTLKATLLKIVKTRQIKSTSQVFLVYLVGHVQKGRTCDTRINEHTKFFTQQK